jgi:hypothetical protein
MLLPLPQQLVRAEVLRQLRYDFESLSFRSARRGHTHLKGRREAESSISMRVECVKFVQQEELVNHTERERGGEEEV